jgi:hypothetical protein
MVAAPSKPVEAALEDLVGEALRFDAARRAADTDNPAPAVAEVPQEQPQAEEQQFAADQPQPAPKSSPQSPPEPVSEHTVEATPEPEPEVMAAPTDLQTTRDSSRKKPDRPATKAQAAPELFWTFTAVPVAVIGEPTSDNRILGHEVELSFRQPPLALQWQRQASEGHQDSYTIGVIEDIHREDDHVKISGYLLNTPEAEEAQNLIRHGVSNPSVDLAGAEWHFTDKDGEKLTPDRLMEYLEAGNPLYRKITKGEIVGTTLVAMPAFGTVRFTLDDERQPRDLGLVASAAAGFKPRVYNHRLFEDPKLARQTHLTMDDDGRIFGHMAVFGQCHRSVQSDCVYVPRSPSGYAHFHTSPMVRLDDGRRISVGRLTAGGGHADPRLKPAPAAAHYDDVGTCFALVRAGEDEHGIWVSGVAAPGASPEIIEQGLSAPLSGDWRNFGQGLDLIAVLAVNTPGYAVLGVDDDDGIPATLVASVGPAPRAGHRGLTVTRADIKRWIKEAFSELQLPDPAPAVVVADAEPTTAKQVSAPEASGPDVELGELAADEPPLETNGDGRSPNELILDMLAQAGL